MSDLICFQEDTFKESVLRRDERTMWSWPRSKLNIRHETDNIGCYSNIVTDSTSQRPTPIMLSECDAIWRRCEGQVQRCYLRWVTVQTFDYKGSEIFGNGSEWQKGMAKYREMLRDLVTRSWRWACVRCSPDLPVEERLRLSWRDFLRLLFTSSYLLWSLLTCFNIANKSHIFSTTTSVPALPIIHLLNDLLNLTPIIQLDYVWHIFIWQSKHLPNKFDSICLGKKDIGSTCSTCVKKHRLISVCGPRSSLNGWQQEKNSHHFRSSHAISGHHFSQEPDGEGFPIKIMISIL